MSHFFAKKLLFLFVFKSLEKTKRCSCSETTKVTSAGGLTAMSSVGMSRRSPCSLLRPEDMSSAPCRLLLGSLTLADVKGPFDHLLKQLRFRLPATSPKITAMGFGQELKRLQDRSPVTASLWPKLCCFCGSHKRLTTGEQRGGGGGGGKVETFSSSSGLQLQPSP